MIKKILVLFFVFAAPMTIPLLAKRKTERVDKKSSRQDVSSKSQKIIAELHIRVKGMVCPFCSSRLDVVLKKLPFVEGIKNINIENGAIEVLIKEGTEYTLDTMRSDLEKTITEATFKFNGIEKVIEK